MFEFLTDAMLRPAETWMILTSFGVLYINQHLISNDIKALASR